MIGLVVIILYVVAISGIVGTSMAVRKAKSTLKEEWRKHSSTIKTGLLLGILLGFVKFVLDWHSINFFNIICTWFYCLPCALIGAILGYVISRKRNGR